LNVETLEGPLPDLSSLVNLDGCSFIPSGLCLPNDFMPPVYTDNCQFDELPQCNPDTPQDFPQKGPSDVQTTVSNLPFGNQSSETQPMNIIIIAVVTSILGTLFLFGAIGIVVYRVRKRRQNKLWKEPGSSFTPSEAFAMDAYPSEDLISSNLGKKQGSSKGKKLVCGPKISAGGFGEVYKGKFDGTPLLRDNSFLLQGAKLRSRE
jgi:hypothetical protein